MKACGIGLKRISKPIFIFALFMALLNFVINETIVPATISQSKTLALYSIVERNIPDGKRNFTIKELKEGNSLKRLFYVEKCENKQFSNVSILDLSKQGKIEIYEAKTGTSVIDGWQLNNASGYYISEQGKAHFRSWTEKTVIDFGSDIKKQLDKKNDGSDLKIKELMPYMKCPCNFKEKDSKKLTNISSILLEQTCSSEKHALKCNEALKNSLLIKYQIKFWEKFALPVAAFAFVLIGIPFAITPPRARHNRGLLFTIGIIFFYYLLRAFSMSLGYNEVLTPFWAVNLPNIIIGIIGYLMYLNKAQTIS